MFEVLAKLWNVSGVSNVLNDWGVDIAFAVCVQVWNVSIALNRLSVDKALHCLTCSHGFQMCDVFTCGLATWTVARMWCSFFRSLNSRLAKCQLWRKSSESASARAWKHHPLRIFAQSLCHRNLWTRRRQERSQGHRERHVRSTECWVIRIHVATFFFSTLHLLVWLCISFCSCGTDMYTLMYWASRFGLLVRPQDIHLCDC